MKWGWCHAGSFHAWRVHFTFRVFSQVLMLLVHIPKSAGYFWLLLVASTSVLVPLFNFRDSCVCFNHGPFWGMDGLLPECKNISISQWMQWTLLGNENGLRHFKSPQSCPKEINTSGCCTDLANRFAHRLWHLALLGKAPVLRLPEGGRVTSI